MQLQSDHYRPATEIDIMRELLPLEDARVLELGCGAARWTRTLAARFPIHSLIATEVDQIQHQKNLQIDDLPNVEFQLGGAEAIDLPDASIDIVIMLKSLHHVPMDRMDQALSEIHRVLRPGGLAYISEPVYAGEFNDILRLFNDEQTVRKAAFNTLKKAVGRGDFQLEQEIFFAAESRFEDFSDFERRVVFPTHSDHGVDAAMRERVKAAFEPHMGKDGAVFINPHRVDLLRKI